MVGAVPEASDVTPVWLGFAPATTGSAVDTQLALEVGFGTAVFPDAEVCAWPGCPLSDAVPPTVGVLPPPPACVPLPSVRALPRGGPPPPLSDELAWRIAWRNGWTPSAMLARTAIPASTVTSRSHPMPHSGKLVRRDRRSWSALSPGSEPGQARCPGQVQVQCPCQVQCRTRSTRPARTLNSQDRGGRLPIRARILSSPSVAGSTSLAASDRARRSASSRQSSPGEVMPSYRLPAAASLRLLLQGRLQCRHRTGRVTLHGPPADSHRLGDVGLGEVPVVPEYDGFSLARR
ncbi:MAG: hypothetical protein QOG28_3521 [Trebonia sp.]|nr:hypothetical protein [Trebonia sp.]